MYNDQHMVDIETMGKAHDAVIMSVAIVKFDLLARCEPEVVLNMHIPAQPQKDAGRVVDPSTVSWWREQSHEAQLRLVNGQKAAEGMSLSEARTRIDHALDNPRAIWANGPDFDCVILRDFMGPTYRWPFWTHRCVRTLKNLWPVEVALPVTAHDAVEDCMFQIRQVQAVMKLLDRSHQAI